MSGARSSYPPHSSAEDQHLFERAREQIHLPYWRSCSRQLLQELAEQHGIDLVTAAFCEAIRNSPKQAEFICDVEVDSQLTIGNPPEILLVPGAFYRQHRHTGADGQRILQIAGELNWPVTIAPIKSFGSLETNSSILLDSLRRSTARRILLVSLSKGSSEVVMALRHPEADEAFSKVCAWVSLSGMCTGTMLVPWLRSHRLRTFAVHLMLWGRGQRFRTVDQLRGDNDGPLCGEIAVPKFPAIHIVGFPLRRHLNHPWAPRGYERLAPIGPNDGGGILLADVGRFPGLVYPAWGADHYLNPAWDASPLVRKILLHAARSQMIPTTSPASRSTA